MRRILLFIIISVPLTSLGQNYKVEAGLKASIWNYEATGPDFNLAYDYMPMFTMDLYYFIHPNIGIGVFHTSSAYVEANGEYYDAASRQNRDLEGVGAFQQYGAGLQFSTNREKRLRLYGTAGILNAQQVIKFDGFTTGKSGIGYSGGIGIVVKITRSISVNLISAQYILYDKDFGLADKESNGIKFDTGLIFKMFREK